MSTPVSADDIVAGAVKYLESKASVRAAIGSYPLADGAPYLFQHQWWVQLEGTGSTGVRIFRDGGWAAPNMHNTMRFHRLGVEIHADPLRDDSQMIVEPGETWRRIDRAFVAIDRRLHRPQGGDQWWGTCMTMSSTRLAEPVIAPVVEGDGMLRLLVYYGVTGA